MAFGWRQKNLLFPFLNGSSGSELSKSTCRSAAFKQLPLGIWHKKAELLDCIMLLEPKASGAKCAKRKILKPPTSNRKVYELQTSKSQLPECRTNKSRLDHNEFWRCVRIDAMRGCAAWSEIRIKSINERLQRWQKLAALTPQPNWR